MYLKLQNAGFASICLPMLAVSLAGQTPPWNHNPSSPDGPRRWGIVTPAFGTCGTAADLAGKPVVQVGMKQTPIDIEDTKAVAAVLPALSFRYGETPFEVENTGHVVEVVYETGSSLRTGASPVDEYKLIQFHFHAPSEHTVNGKSYDAELHLVHANAIGEITVVGVLLNQSASASPGLYDAIMQAAPAKPGAGKVAGKSIDAKDLLPVSRSYYTYTGSLTTPPCTESVRWFVLVKPVDITAASLVQLHSLIGKFPGYDGFENNNRPVAPLNQRTVLRVQ